MKNYKPRSVHAERFHARTARFAVFLAHRRYGTTTMLVNDVLQNAQAKPGTYAYVCAPKRDGLSNARSLLVDQLGKDAHQYTDWLQCVVVGEGGYTERVAHTFTLPNGSVIHLFSADQLNLMRGHPFDGVALDGFDNETVQKAYREMLRAAVADKRGWMVFADSKCSSATFQEILGRVATFWEERYQLIIARPSETGFDSCPKCGMENEKDSQACWACGTPRGAE